MPSPPFTPLQIEERELAGGLAAIAPRSTAAGAPYRAARVLVRLHSHPVGAVDVPLAETGVGSEELGRAIEAALGDRVRRHLARDGVVPAGPLAEGIATAPDPPCLSDRRALLADAPAITVVVPTRERPEPLRRCVDSVLGSEYPAERVEVLVVDNAPSDGRTRDAVERHYGDRVGYLVAPRPGSASARNDGAAAAGAELVAFVDDDVVVDRHWLAEIALGFEAAPSVSCVTGLVVAAELDTPAQLLFEEYGGMGKGFDDALYDLGDNRPDHPLFPFNAAVVGSGNNVAFRRAALLEAGGYDPALGNGTPARAGEDWELFLRLFRDGHTVAYRAGAIVHHRHRRELEDLRGQIRDYGVGLAAALTRTVAHHPGAALEIARRLPYGAWFLLSSRSSKNRNRSDGYPAGLRRAELAGIARGPAAYLRSRRRT